MKKLHIQPSEIDNMPYTDYILLLKAMEYEMERNTIDNKRYEQIPLWWKGRRV